MFFTLCCHEKFLSFYVLTNKFNVMRFSLSLVFLACAFSCTCTNPPTLGKKEREGTGGGYGYPKAIVLYFNLHVTSLPATIYANNLEFGNYGSIFSLKRIKNVKLHGFTLTNTVE